MAVFTYAPKWIKGDLAFLLRLKEAGSHMADWVLCVQWSVRAKE